MKVEMKCDYNMPTSLQIVLSEHIFVRIGYYLLISILIAKNNNVIRFELFDVIGCTLLCTKMMTLRLFYVHIGRKLYKTV